MEDRAGMRSASLISGQVVCSVGSPCISFPICTTSLIFKAETSDQMLQTLRGQKKALGGSTIQP